MDMSATRSEPSRRRIILLLLYGWPLGLAALAVALITAHAIPQDDTTVFLSGLLPAAGSGVAGIVQGGAWPKRIGWTLAYAVVGAMLYCAAGTAIAMIVALVLIATR